MMITVNQCWEFAHFKRVNLKQSNKSDMLSTPFWKGREERFALFYKSKATKCVRNVFKAFCSLWESDLLLCSKNEKRCELILLSSHFWIKELKSWSAKELFPNPGINTDFSVFTGVCEVVIFSRQLKIWFFILFSHPLGIQTYFFSYM